MINLHNFKAVSLIFRPNIQRSISSLKSVQNSAADSRKLLKKSDHYFSDYHLVNEVQYESGAIKSVPKWYRLGIFKLFVTFTTFLLVGAQMSKSGTRFLEENDIFKPEDDDDDDEDSFN